MSRGVEAVETLALQEVQKAGLCLDGCKIFLSGFSNAHLEKLRRVLNFGGATRFNQLSDAVSHMVIGETQEILSILHLLNQSICLHFITLHFSSQCINFSNAFVWPCFNFLLYGYFVITFHFFLFSMCLCYIYVTSVSYLLPHP